MKRPQITSAFQQSKYLLLKTLATVGLLAASVYSQAQPLWGQDRGDITLPADYRPGYKPSIKLLVEEDVETGTYIAHPETQARFNRLWMNQEQHKTGKQAQKALVKMGAKALYKMVYQRSKAAKNFLPNEEGKIALKSNYKKYKLDYDVHLRSSSLAVGMNMKF